MAAQSPKDSQVRIGEHGANDAVPPANESEEKQSADQELLPPDEWSMNPQNPVNWSSTRKWTIVILLWVTLTVTYASRLLWSQLET